MVSMRVSHPCGGALPAVRLLGGVFDGQRDLNSAPDRQGDVFSHPAGHLKRRTSGSGYRGCQGVSPGQGLSPGTAGAAEHSEEHTCPTEQAQAACASFLQVLCMRAAGPKERWFGGVAFPSGKKLRAVSQKTTNGLDFQAACIMCNYTAFNTLSLAVVN